MARILVVDDNGYIRGAVRQVLSRGGHQVWDVPAGHEALKLLEVAEFDLILTDVYMGEMDGMEFLQRVRERGVTVPVVVMTGGGATPREQLLQLARTLGAAATIEKPFSPSALRRTIGAVVGARPD